MVAHGCWLSMNVTGPEALQPGVPQRRVGRDGGPLRDTAPGVRLILRRVRRTGPWSNYPHIWIRRRTGGRGPDPISAGQRSCASGPRGAGGHSRGNQRVARLANAQDTDPEALRRVLRLRASVSQAASARVPVALKLIVGAQGSGILVFHEWIDQAERIRGGLERLGIRARSYHSRLGTPTRLLNLHLFRERQVDVLVTCRALDEGLDVPQASVGVIAASTSSTRQRIQRMGRTLRRSEAKDLATVYTLFCLDTERKRLEREAEKLLWNRKRRLA